MQETITFFLEIFQFCRDGFSKVGSIYKAFNKQEGIQLNYEAINLLQKFLKILIT